ncbi:MAG: hypothetical protein M2R45_03288 [Verrucomicrobia subdivision 3 bacterium]|nr:hypothetical protein [Limisphaerales bacterium]MCS1415434.1 hypothetical protein [Limisphaerales bacterium]
MSRNQHSDLDGIEMLQIGSRMSIMNHGDFIPQIRCGPNHYIHTKISHLTTDSAFANPPLCEQRIEARLKERLASAFITSSPSSFSMAGSNGQPGSSSAKPTPGDL